ncbi:ABC transporter substrate-binding protein [Alphaproteobacteria bacterium LSUCC0719]
MRPFRTVRHIIALSMAVLMALATTLATALSGPALAGERDFAQTLAAARGQTVYFNAWGGDDKINDYIAWAGEELAKRHGITLKHVKLSDTAAAVSRILAEQAAGRSAGGSIDLLWVNGENFAALKQNNLLQDTAWADSLPSWQYTDAESLPAIRLDFAVPTDGLESPWGRAQLVFAHDSNRLASPPRNAAELATYINSTPGRFTYPQPPDFVGLSFLKQILIETAEDTTPFYQPVDSALFDQVSEPLWRWLDSVTPNLWRGGRAYPANYPLQRQLLADGEVDITIAFNPADASSAIERGELPDSVRTYIHDTGTIANVHFLAIPFNATASEAAQVVADFLLSPEAQIRKADPAIWGDPTVLAMHRLSAKDLAGFMALPQGVATLSEADLARTLAEPHPSWMKAIEAEWRRRYASGD